jgi:hypothetical protein
MKKFNEILKSLDENKIDYRVFGAQYALADISGYSRSPNNFSDPSQRITVCGQTIFSEKKFSSAKSLVRAMDFCGLLSRQ